MTDHLAVLEERLASLESALKHAGTLAPDDYGYRFVARCRKEAEALRAAIALMRGQSDMVLVPRTLTAENGAKGALIGEFTTPFVMQCLECTDGFVDDEVCDDCDGAGSFTVRVPVEWTTIKDIHKAMIAHFHPAPKEPADEQ